MKWERSDVSEIKKIPGCIDVDMNGTSFISAMFKMADGRIVRIRHESYSVIFERKIVPTEKAYIVNFMAGTTELVQEFKTYEDAEQYAQKLDISASEIKEVEKEILDPINAIEHKNAEVLF